MARPPLTVPMNIGSGRTIFVKVPQKIIDYFNMDAAVVAGTTTQITRERRAHVRRRFTTDQISGTTGTPIAVGVARWSDIGGRSRSGRGTGKLIKIPTEVPYDPANLAKGYRLVSLRIPNAATNYVIAQWINTTFTAHKPVYFLTVSGQQYPVAVPTVADPNPGNDNDATGTTTP